MDKRVLIFVVCITATLFFVNQWFSHEDKPAAAKAQTETQVTESSPMEETANQRYATSLPSSKEEKFYVIENGYQQLVFSNVGGSLAEINLKLYDKENPQIPVRPIRFDKVMAKEFPGNDQFPSVAYQINDGSGIQTKEGQLGGYYPLLRRSLFGAKGDVLKKSSPRYYALNVVEDTPGAAEPIYRVKRLEKDLIEFESDQPQRKITKTFSFAKNAANAPYCIETSIKVEGDARNLYLTSGVPEVELIS